ncbi:NADH-quinone oxidoreductase subunit NuoG [Desulfovibrio gilichinskyi]|uniref:NADH-quinone oxidoreductase n=1 Tax=Desulfovibrio gilichinskyi TaxID=1519643 RepID=A0A1X7DDK5_9BACT|nr:NADH-quinone oxidoreductase subunit NuoG [Desulfovibrio gilichinskyi]SMF13328.1 NADH dehydrogenase subunit G [Desulfovibrio gilichinskyi]
MPKLIIDGQEVEVEPGTKVIDAAERLGIMIPRFCYLKSLGAVGACRMCAVKFLKGNKKDLDMSCMVEARDGMIISTDHPDAVAFRAQVIEWLMLSHPHDCPVCDEGGHCLLQDMTVSGGHGRRNFRGLKRTYKNQYLGHLIEHEMNRCIHCYRCVRFYREYAGGTDFGTFGIAGRVTYQRFEPGSLESPFSGNLGEICPTGTLTDKPARYRARRWDLERKPSICAHCSLGCNTLPAVHYREVLRVENRYNENINGDFLCDRGRYGFEYASLTERPRQTRVKGTPTTPEHGAEETIKRIREILEQHGPQSVGIHVSSRCTLEDMLTAEELAANLKLSGPSFFMTEEERIACLEAASLLGTDISRSLRQVREADMVLILGSDPLHEGPMAALAVRQAARTGAIIGVLDPRPVNLLCETIHLPLTRHQLPAAIDALLDKAFPETEFQGEPSVFRQELRELASSETDKLTSLAEPLANIAAALASARRPVLICSADTMPTGWLSLVAGVTRLLRETGSENRMDAGMFCILPKANSMGAGILGAKNSTSLQNFLTPMDNAQPIKGLICIGDDPLTEFPAEQWIAECFGKLDLLVCMDCIDSATWKKADIAIPQSTLFETGGCLINNEGRLQRAMPVFAGGTPVTQTGKGSHPPRNTDAPLTGNGPQNAGHWLKLLMQKTDKSEHHSHAALRSAMDQATSAESFNMLPDVPVSPFPSLESLASFIEKNDGNKSGEILVTASTFGSDRLANEGPLGEKLLNAPVLWLHPDETARLGIEEGQTVLVPLSQGLASVKLQESMDMAHRTAVLSKTPESGWQNVGGLAAPFNIEHLWREQADEETKAAADIDPDNSCPNGRV